MWKRKEKREKVERERFGKKKRKGSLFIPWVGCCFFCIGLMVHGGDGRWEICPGWTNGYMSDCCF